LKIVVGALAATALVVSFGLGEDSQAQRDEMLALATMSEMDAVFTILHDPSTSLNTTVCPDITVRLNTRETCESTQTESMESIKCTRACPGEEKPTTQPILEPIFTSKNNKGCLLVPLFIVLPLLCIALSPASQFAFCADASCSAPDGKSAACGCKNMTGATGRLGLGSASAHTPRGERHLSRGGLVSLAGGKEGRRPKRPR